MDSTFIELRVANPSELQPFWLEHLPHGGIFIPGELDVTAGVPVRLCIVVEGTPPGSTLLEGTVIHRRTSAGSSAPPPALRKPALLRPGVGVAFDDVSQSRAEYLIQRSRGLLEESRGGLRWPVSVPAHVVLREGEKPVRVSLEDVGTRGARISLPPGLAPDLGASATLAIRSADLEVQSAFVGAVAWIDHRSIGLTFALETKEDRARWAKLVTRARESFERRRSAAFRLA